MNGNNICEAPSTMAVYSYHTDSQLLLAASSPFSMAMLIDFTNVCFLPAVGQTSFKISLWDKEN